MKKKGLQDFGEKISGARKELWAGLKISEIDFEALSEDEKRLFVKKDVLWPKPKREELREEGVDPIVIFWQEEMRKAVYSAPKTSVYEKPDIIGFASFCIQFSEAVNCCTSMQDIRNFYEKSIFEFLKKCSTYSWDYIKDKYRYFFRGNLVLKYLSEDALKKAYNAKPFMETKEDFIRKNFLIVPFPFTSPEMTVRRFGDQKGQRGIVLESKTSKRYFYPFSEDENYLCDPDLKGYFLLYPRRSQIIAFGTEEECEDAKDKYVKKEVAIDEAHKKQGKKSILPPQLTDIRRTGSNYSIMKTISGEMLVNRFKIRGGQFGNYTSEKDRRCSLAMAYDALEDLAEAMGIADENIGLSGLGIAFGARGRGNALAHYEEINNVINLTKLRGAGSLAHEYGHALEAFIKNTHITFPSYSAVHAAFKKQSGKTTTFYRNSVFFDRDLKKAGNGYWASEEELFARAFACYIHDKLGEKKSDYLVGHSESAIYMGRAAFPEGEERKNIDQLFDGLVKEMIASGVFTGRARKTLTMKSSPMRTDCSFPQAEDGQLCFF